MSGGGGYPRLEALARVSLSLFRGDPLSIQIIFCPRRCIPLQYTAIFLTGASGMFEALIAANSWCPVARRCNALAAGSWDD